MFKGSEVSEVPKASDVSAVPEVPEVPDGSEVPEVPKVSQVPDVSEGSEVPEDSQVTEVPKVSEGPRGSDGSPSLKKQRLEETAQDLMFKKYGTREFEACEICFRELNVATPALYHFPGKPFSHCFDHRKPNMKTTSFKTSLAAWSNKRKIACYLAGQNPLKPCEIFIGSRKRCNFQCDSCLHLFERSLHHVTHVRSRSFCPFCAGRKLCGQEDCEPCFNRSLASWEDKAKLECFLGSAKSKKLHEIFKCGPEKCSFKCDVCQHTFVTSANNLTKPEKPRWCPYCSIQAAKLCGDEDCKHCWQRSLASWDAPKKLMAYKAGNNPLPAHQVCLNSGKYFWFKCFDCQHRFKVRLATLTRKNPTWCRFCQNRVCGEPDCDLCAQACEVRSVCKPRQPNKAQVRTRVTQRWVCNPCLLDVQKRDPEETPIQARAKLTLEIFTLAELQRQAMNSDKMTNFLWSEPTAWDCAILPGLSYKPDNIWCFDHQGNPFHTAGGCKINSAELSYVLQLEIIEHGMEQHSKARQVSDAQREQEIRTVFGAIPMGVVYVVMAHTKHPGADPADVFFTKNPSTDEYMVFPERLQSWQERIGRLTQTLLELYRGRLNETRIVH